MIYLAHTGTTPSSVYRCKAERWASMLGPGCAVIDTRGSASPPELADDDSLVAVWWRAAIPYEGIIPDGCRLILRVSDHRSWTCDPHWDVLRRRAQAVVACSRMLVDALRERGVAATYMRDGVDPAVFRPGEHRPGHRDRLQVGWVGDTRIAAKRGGLVRALMLAAARLGIDIRMIDGSSTMPHDQMPAWYRELDALLIVSATEGTPNPALEAAATGLPIVSTPVGLIPEMIEDGARGIRLLPAMADREQVLEGLRWLVEHRLELADVGMSNRIIMEKHYRWDVGPLVALLREPRTISRPARAQEEQTIIYQDPGCPRMRVLIACTQRPGWGGAATSSYGLIRALRAVGVDAIGCYIDRWAQRPSMPADPEGIGGIIAAEYPREGHRIRVEGRWDAIIAKGYLAPTLIERTAPILYLTSSIPELSNGSGGSGEAAIGQPGSRTMAALEASDGMLCHSDIDWPIYFRTLPEEQRRKLLPRPLQISDTTVYGMTPSPRPYRERTWDIVAVASRWTRAVKGWAIMAEILRLYPQLGIAVAGEAATVEHRAHKALGLLSHAEIISLLCDARVVLIPSQYDSAPGIYAEAVISGCNIIVGPRVGYTTGHPESLRAAEWRIEDYVACVDRARRMKKQHAYRAIDPVSVASDMVAMLREWLRGREGSCVC